MTPSLQLSDPGQGTSWAHIFLPIKWGHGPPSCLLHSHGAKLNMSWCLLVTAIRAVRYTGICWQHGRLQACHWQPNSSGLEGKGPGVSLTLRLSSTMPLHLHRAVPTVTERSQTSPDMGPGGLGGLLCNDTAGSFALSSEAQVSPPLAQASRVK